MELIVPRVETVLRPSDADLPNADLWTTIERSIKTFTLRPDLRRTISFETVYHNVYLLYHRPQSDRSRIREYYVACAGRGAQFMSLRPFFKFLDTLYAMFSYAIYREELYVRQALKRTLGVLLWARHVLRTAALRETFARWSEEAWAPPARTGQSGGATFERLRRDFAHRSKRLRL